MTGTIEPENRAKIWAGYFQSEAEFKAFIAESYSEDEDHYLSAFSESQNEHWFDHDWIECVFHSDGVTDQFYSLAKGEKEKIIAYIEAEALAPLNATITYFEPSADKKFEQFKSPQSIITDTFRLHYIGSFRPNDSFL